jgi:hypothetical protein
MTDNQDSDMLEEYDFSAAVRGKHAERYREGTNIIKLDEDVASVFPDSKSVNEALRALAKIIHQHEKKSRHGGETTSEAS